MLGCAGAPGPKRLYVGWGGSPRTPARAPAPSASGQNQMPSASVRRPARRWGALAPAAPLRRARCRAAHAGQMADVLRLAATYQATVFPRGGGSHTFIGQAPTRVDLVLSVQRLQRQLAYEPADLTTTVQAGVRFAELQHILRASGQCLAL